MMKGRVFLFFLHHTKKIRSRVYIFILAKCSPDFKTARHFKAVVIQYAKRFAVTWAIFDATNRLSSKEEALECWWSGKRPE